MMTRILPNAEKSDASDMEILSRPAIERVLTTRWLGRPLYYWPATGSTNTFLKEMAAGGEAPAGAMAITDFQTQGKGRLDRRWEAPAGTSLLFSLFFQPGWPAERAAWLTMIAGLAAVAAVKKETGLALGLKWPNDLVVVKREGWRKLGGILLECDLAEGRLETAVAGIGLNVNIPPEKLPAGSPALPPTSLLIEAKQTVSRLNLLARLLRDLEERYEWANQGQSPLPAWQEKLVTLGQRVAVTMAGSSERSPIQMTGIAEGVDDWGRLLLRDRAGKVHALAAGDATLQSSDAQV